MWTTDATSTDDGRRTRTKRNVSSDLDWPSDARAQPDADVARSTGWPLDSRRRVVADAQYAPGVIRDGAPYPLVGEAAKQAREDKQQRRGCTGLAASR